MLIQLFYVSERSTGTSDVDVRTILSSSEIGNRRRDITGMLAQSGRHFAQVLEGRADAIDTLMSRIRADPRHRAIHVAFRRVVAQRAFDRWAMGFVHRDDAADAITTFHVATDEDAPASQSLYELLFLRRTDQDALAEGYARRPDRQG